MHWIDSYEKLYLLAWDGGPRFRSIFIGLEISEWFGYYTGLMEVLMAIVDCFIMVFCGLGFYYAVDSILLSIETKKVYLFT